MTARPTPELSGVSDFTPNIPPLLPISIPEELTRLAATSGSLPLKQLVQFGPKSMWRGEIGDLRNFFTIFSGGLLQLADPVIGKAIETQSEFFGGTWARLDRSARGIAEIFVSDNATKVGHTIRNYHRHISGVDRKGQTVSALHPEPYTWGWLTILWSAEQRRIRFDRQQLSAAEWEAWYQEGRIGYRCQGVSDKFLPSTYGEYREYFADVCRTRLRRTPAFNRALEQLETGNVDRPPQVPPLVWNGLAQRALSKYLHILAVGGLPAELRESLDIPWGKPESLALKGIDWVIRNVWSTMAPKRVSYHPALVRSILPPTRLHQKVLCRLGEFFADLNFKEQSELALQPSRD